MCLIFRRIGIVQRVYLLKYVPARKDRVDD